MRPHATLSLQNAEASRDLLEKYCTQELQNQQPGKTPGPATQKLEAQKGQRAGGRGAPSQGWSHVGRRGASVHPTVSSRDVHSRCCSIVALMML